MATRFEKRNRPQIQRTSDESEEEDDNTEEDEQEEDDNEQEVERNNTMNITAMASLPLAKLAQLKAKLGAALFNKAMYGEDTSLAVEGKSDRKEPKKTASAQKRPRTESSNRPPPKIRQIKGVTLSNRKNARFDPRFSSACGDFDEVAYHRDYSFLDELRKCDIKELQKAYRQAKKEQNLSHAKRVKQNLLRLQNQQKSHRDQLLMEQIRGELRQNNIERMNSGLPPLYMNNHELKERFLERKRQIYGDTAATTTPVKQDEKQGDDEQQARTEQIEKNKFGVKSKKNEMGKRRTTSS